MHEKRSYWQPFRRWLLYITGGSCALLGLLTIAALAPRQWHTAATDDCRYTIYVAGDQMHTNLIVPVQNPVVDWGKSLNLAQTGVQAAYLQFGWGDRAFYVETPSWDQVSVMSALRALLWQNPAALFVQAHPAVPQPPHEVVKCVKLGEADYRALMQFLESSFQRDERGKVMRLKGTTIGEGEFYAATGKYSMFKTCNSWTADGLRVANVNTPIWGGLAPAVMRQIRNGCSCEPMP